jgi:hypothetical protein
MTVRRDSGAMAVLLADGRVLVAGGIADEQALASADLYSPATGTFSATGSMTTARAGDGATLLRSGKVLISGCRDAELYDPATGEFSPAAPMAYSSCNHTSTLLADGRVLLAGGYGDAGWASSAQLYDPATGTSSATGSLKTARENAQAVLLRDGRVLIVGGDQSDGGPDELELASAEVYDPATGTFSVTGSMQAPRTHHAAILLADGTVLVVGGYNIEAHDPGATAEIYDPTTGKFTRSGSMARLRPEASANLLPDGRVLVMGGVDSSGEIYDPISRSFAPVPAAWPDAANVGEIASISLLDGRVLFPGTPSVLFWP